jgi:hypothetical protein
LKVRSAESLGIQRQGALACFGVEDIFAFIFVKDNE